LSANLAIPGLHRVRAYDYSRTCGLMPLDGPQVYLHHGIQRRAIQPAIFSVNPLRKNIQYLGLTSGLEPRLAGLLSLYPVDLASSEPTVRPLLLELNFAHDPQFGSRLQMPAFSSIEVWENAELEPLDLPIEESLAPKWLGNSLVQFSTSPVRPRDVAYPLQAWVPKPAKPTLIDVQTTRPLEVVKTLSNLFSRSQAVPDESAFASISILGELQSRKESRGRVPVVIGSAIRFDAAKCRQEISMQNLSARSLGCDKPGLFIPRLGMGTLRPQIAWTDAHQTAELAIAG